MEIKTGDTVRFTDGDYIDPNKWIVHSILIQDGCVIVADKEEHNRAVFVINPQTILLEKC